MTPLTALIVDDEPLARDLLREMLSVDPDFAIVGECRSGAEAVTATLSRSPDLLFLDVQMPEMNGFEVVEAIGPERMPGVVFVTAYDRYAVRAFEVNALDYLLKPFDEERLARTLSRVKAERRRSPAELGARLLAMLEQVGRATAPATRLVIHDAGRAVLVPLEDIDWIEAAGKYVTVHAGKVEHLLRESVSALETQLDPRQFARIHRSTIVRVDRIREVRTLSGGEYVVILRDGTALGTSRGYRHLVKALIGRGS